MQEHITANTFLHFVTCMCSWTGHADEREHAEKPARTTNRRIAPQINHRPAARGSNDADISGSLPIPTSFPLLCSGIRVDINPDD